LDESQNCTYEQLKMAVTRLGHNSKCVINGDPQQSDLPNSGLKAIIGALASIDDVGTVRFTAAEVERSEIVKKVVVALERFESKS
jgi:phosphate starvation-inducible PhoH-like protein